MELAESVQPSLTAGDIEVRPDEGLVRVAGRPLVVSRLEVGVLVALLRNREHVVSRQELYRLVWGRELRRGDRSVDVYVHKLRSKLESAVPGRRLIHTHPGFGYRLGASNPDKETT